MSATNTFHAEIECPHCRARVRAWFDADIGTLRRADFEIGDLVFTPGVTPAKPYGPSAQCDFSRPLWATGLGRCPQCHTDLRARICTRDGRFTEVWFPDLQDRDDDWGYLDEGDRSQ